MEEFVKYYRLLGLPQGASAEEVKKAFRSRIKECHPDTAASEKESAQARELIEAYQALKHGPPAGFAARAGTSARGGGGSRPRGNSSAPGFGTRPRTTPGPEFQSDISRFARAAGRRLYEEMFGDSPLHPRFRARDPRKPNINIENVWERLAEEIWGDGEDVQMYGDNVEVREFRRPEEKRHELFRETPGVPLSQAERYYNRAEILLREIVRKYDSQESLKRKGWVREYLTGLGNVQVLFRDVANRHPSLSARALDRVRQIGELTRELRAML